MSARHSQPATSPVGEKGEKSLFINAETGYGIVLSQNLFSPEKGSAAQSSCWADFPSPCASPRCTPVGEGRSGKAWLGLAWPGLAWLCDLAGFGSADGTPEAGGGSGAGEGLGVPAVRVGLHADPSLQKSCVSTCTGIWLHIPSQSSRDVNFKKGGLPCGLCQ